MVKRISGAFNGNQLTAIVIAIVLFLVAIFNATFNAGLLGIPVVTYSVLTIFLASIVLWLFVAIDWPSILCLVALGFLPGMTYGEIFQQSFGNVTYVFLFFTFIVT